VNTTQQRPAKPADPMLGRVVAGRYRLEARAGEGGMGVVYRARHVLIDRVVALKLIRPDLRGETHLRAWMLREARAANRVDHAHIIDIHDIGETEEGELYLVMEYLVGTSLSSELAKGPMPLARGVDILEQMCAALARAHDLGVIHRDLKSDNILMTTRGGRKDFVKILDFGLAHLARDPRLAPKGACSARPSTCPPSRRAAKRPGPRAISTRSACSSSRCSRGSSRSAPAIARRCSRCSARRRRPPTAIKPDILPAGRGDRAEAPREGAAQALPRRPPPPRRAEGAPARAPVGAVGGGAARGERASPSPAASAVGRRHRVGEPRGALLAHGELARTRAGTPRPTSPRRSPRFGIWPRGPTRLEGEVASHTRKLESLERRGRALRAEIGRKVEELAHEESRVLRELANEQGEANRLREALATAERAAMAARQQADQIAQTPPSAQWRVVFERAGAAQALVDARREALGERERKAGAKDGQVRDLRRQIEELRSQLSRYAEALEEDLASGREKVAARTREGLGFEKAFSDASQLLLTHLKGKAEARDLLQDLLANMHGAPQGGSKPSDGRPAT
jgi:serine/threonine protein kinase